MAKETDEVGAAVVAEVAEAVQKLVREEGGLFTREFTVGRKTYKLTAAEKKREQCGIPTGRNSSLSTSVV
jgi:hypothetical protein